MTEPVPDNSNRVAYWLGYLFHPAVVCIPTLALVLNDLPALEALQWTVLIAAIVTMPGFITVMLLRRQNRYTYQRQPRRPIYLVAWLSVVAGLVVILLLDGPEALRVCLAALIVWLPVQLLINTYYTKISTHVAVVAGCSAGLWMLGKLSIPLQIVAVTVIVLTIWARVTTRNHTVPQVLLGLAVGAGSVLAVFPFMLG